MSPAQIEEVNHLLFLRNQMREFLELIDAYPWRVGEAMPQVVSEFDAARAQLEAGVDVHLVVPAFNRARKLAGLRPLDLPLRVAAPSLMAAQQQAAQRPPGTPGQFLEVVCTSEADHEVDFRFEVSTPAGVQLTRREVKAAIQALIDSKTPRVD